MNLELELKKVVRQIKKTQGHIQDLLKEKQWLEEARKYAESQGKEVKRILRTDLGKVKTFVAKERADIAEFQKRFNRMQKDLPGELGKLKRYMRTQRAEAERFVRRLRKAAERAAQVGWEEMSKKPGRSSGRTTTRTAAKKTTTKSSE